MRTWLSVNTRKSGKSGRGDLGRGAAAARTRVPVIDTHLDAGKLPMRLRDAGRQQTASMTPGRGGGVGSPRGAPPHLGEGWRRRALAGGVTAACHSQWRKCCSREGRCHLPGARALALGPRGKHLSEDSSRHAWSVRTRVRRVVRACVGSAWSVRGLCDVCVACPWCALRVVCPRARVGSGPLLCPSPEPAGSATVWLLNKRDSAKSESAVVT